MCDDCTTLFVVMSVHCNMHVNLSMLSHMDRRIRRYRDRVQHWPAQTEDINVTNCRCANLCTESWQGMTLMDQKNNVKDHQCGLKV